MRLGRKKTIRSTPRLKSPVFPRARGMLRAKVSAINSLYAVPLLLIALSVFVYRQTPIKTVVCTIDTSKPCSAEVQSIADQNLNKNALTLDPKHIETAVMRALPQFESVVADIKLPSTLRVNATLSQPLLQIVTASASAALVVNTNYGIAEFLPSPQADLFSLVSLAPLEPAVGTMVSDPALMAAIRLYQLLKERDIPLSSMVVASGQRIEVTSASVTLLFSGFKPLENQVTSLQIILGTDTMESKPKVIDLRPERPVLQ